MKKVIIFIALMVFLVGCAQPTTPSTDTSSTSGTSTEGTVELVGLIEDEALWEDIWNTYLYDLYWTVFNGSNLVPQTLASDLETSNYNDLIDFLMLKIFREDDIPENIEGRPMKPVVVAISTLKEYGQKYFNYAFDFTKVDTITLNGEEVTYNVAEQQWEFDLALNMYSYRSVDVAFDDPASIAYYPSDRIEKIEEYTDGSIKVYFNMLKETAFDGDKNTEIFVLDVFTFNKHDNGDYYFYSKESTATETNLIKVTGDYTTLAPREFDIFDKNIVDATGTTVLVDDNLTLTSIDLLTGEVLRETSLPYPQYDDYRIYSTKDNLVARFADKSYLLNKDLTGDFETVNYAEHKDKYVFISPDGKNTVYSTADNSFALFNTETEQTTIIEGSDAGEYSVFKPVSFINNNFVLFAEFGYESCLGQAIYNIETNTFTHHQIDNYSWYTVFPTQTGFLTMNDSRSPEEILYYTDFETASFETLVPASENLLFINDDNNMGHYTEKYLAVRKPVNYTSETQLDSPSKQDEIYLLDVNTGEKVSTGVTVTYPGNAKIVMTALDTGEIVVDIRYFSENVSIKI